jgi:phenylpropionate dioxygenase-like ring-hydroxylating dioxygenase large terminal subunit
MRRATQLDIGREIVKRLVDGSTPMTDEVFVNDPSVYTDPERHKREFPQFFLERPLVMGASCQIPNPGDHLTDDHTSLPLVSMRGADGVVRTFANICSHRGSRIVLDEGGCGAKALTCPYHAWVYGLDGSLRAIPGKGFDDVDRSEMGLKQLPTVERAGLIWVLPRQDTDPTSGPTDLGPIVDDLLGAELLADLEAFDLANHHHYGTRHLGRRLNWKLTMDTFFESYHFRQLHKKTIAPLIKSDMAPVRHYDDHHLLVGIRHTAEQFLTQVEDDWDVIGQTVLVYLLFPNTVFIMQRDHIELFRIFPGATVADSEIEISLFIPDEPAEGLDGEKSRRHWDANFDLLVETADSEDFTNGATIQRSFESGMLDKVVYGRNEPLMHSWHRSLRRAVGEVG